MPLELAAEAGERVLGSRKSALGSEFAPEDQLVGQVRKFWYERLGVGPR
jgi:hypothetical protein